MKDTNESASLGPWLELSCVFQHLVYLDLSYAE
jgi:hypothetical protein